MNVKTNQVGMWSRQWPLTCVETVCVCETVCPAHHHHDEAAA